MGAAAIALAIVFGGFLLAYVSNHPRMMAWMIPIASFVTRPTIAIGSFNVRLEMIVGITCLLSLALRVAKRQSFALPAVVWNSVLAVISWFGVVTVSTLLFAPAPISSLGTLSWCVLNLGTALWIATNPAMLGTILRVGSAIALISGASSILLYFISRQIALPYGVQLDPTYGGYASYVMSIEANILGGLLCLWALVALLNPMGCVNLTVRRWLVLIAPVAIITTHTRAALVAFVLGVVFILIMRPTARKLSLAVLLVGGAAAGALISTGRDRGLSKFIDGIDLAGGTGGLRLQVNTVAFNEYINSDSLLVGLGWNTFGQRHIDETQVALQLPAYLGNLPLQVLYDGGIISLALITSATLLVVLPLVRTRKLVPLIVVAVPYLLFSISTSALWLLETWLFVGIGWAYLDMVYGEKRLMDRPRFQVVGTGQGASLNSESVEA